MKLHIHFLNNFRSTSYHSTWAVTELVNDFQAQTAHKHWSSLQCCRKHLKVLKEMALCNSWLFCWNTAHKL